MKIDVDMECRSITLPSKAQRLSYEYIYEKALSQLELALLAVEDKTFAQIIVTANAYYDLLPLGSAMRKRFVELRKQVVIDRKPLPIGKE